MMEEIAIEVINMMGSNEPWETAGTSSCAHSSSCMGETSNSDLLPQCEPSNGYLQWSRELGKLTLLTREEEVELAIRMERNDGKARDRFIESNLMLVMSIVSRYRGCGVPMEDLHKEAAVSLAKAADAFDYRQGSRFSAWAGIRIEGEIGRRLGEMWKNDGPPLSSVLKTRGSYES